MGMKGYFVQLFGFLVKVFTQRWRTPVTTLLEILLPLLFTLLLSIGYWTTHSTAVPEATFNGPAFDFDLMMETGFCRMPWSLIKVKLPTCVPPVPAANKCLSLVGNGEEICMPYAKYGMLSGLLFGAVYYATGPLSIDMMDGYLMMSALVTQDSTDQNPTFFGRQARASMSHYGKLLVSSDDSDLADAFMQYCHDYSAMCGEVLHPTVFPTLRAAKDYAADNAPHVWAIAYLPGDTLTSVDQATFTISMNYSATPETFKKPKRKLFLNDEGEATTPGYVLYKMSGFLTLQNFIQQFFLQQNFANHSLPLVGPANATLVRLFSGAKGAGLVPMPTPSRFDNAFLTKWAYYLPLVAMMAALFPVARLTSSIVEEKAKGIRESMLIMGLHPSCMFGGWYAAALVVDFVASLLAAMMLKVGFLHRVNYGVLLVVYFTYMQQNTALALFLSTVFSNPRIASWCAAFVLFVCFIPFYNFPTGMSTVAKTLATLVPCVGYAESFSMMVDLAAKGETFSWAAANSGPYNVAVAIGMMWASFAILTILALYLDRVAPAAVGCRAHPLFFLMPLFRLCRTEKERHFSMSNREDESTNEPIGLTENGDLMGSVEEMHCKAPSSRLPVNLIEHRDDIVSTRDASVAAIFHKLRKVYICGGVLGFFYTYFTGVFRRGDRVVALDGVTFAMKTGEVSVLLGVNGTGKSTIMGMATGMIKPTSGDVYIRGHNAAYDLDKCRENIGYCPQADIVWSSLTVEEHLAFYARLKGSHTFMVDDAVSKVVDLVGLEEKRTCRAGNLSGGQKRRLCVGMALVGDSSVLFLDEPTAGMDVKGRRAMYETLNRARVNRSVLLSTHLLDEADRIGDRILLVSEGQLRGEGSSMYLKSQMKVGYVVTCVVESGMSAADEDRAVSDLIDFVRDKGYAGHHNDGSEVQAIPASCKLLGVERRGREVAFRFPLSLLSLSGAALLEELRVHGDELHLRGVGLNLTTLEDVFMSVTQDAPLMTADPVAVEGEVQEAEGKLQGAHFSNDAVEYDDDDLYGGKNQFVVFCRHFRALFLKRCHAGKRDFRLLFFQVVLPVVFLLVAFLINLVRSPSQPGLTLDMAMYDDYETDPSVVAYSSSMAVNPFGFSASTPSEAFGEYYVDHFVNPGRGMMVSQTLTPYLQAGLTNFSQRRFVAVSSANLFLNLGNLTNMSAVFVNMEAVLMHNSSFPHAAPQALDAMYSAANYQIWGRNVPRIVTRNDPMKLGEFENELVDASKQVMIGIFVLLAFVLIPSNTISYIVREKESGARHMQLLSGANIAAYWLSSFVFDVACYIGTEILTFIIFAIFNRTEYIGSRTFGPAAVLFLFYGITSVSTSYALSFFFKSPFAAQTVVLLANFVMGFLWVTVEDMLLKTALTFVRVVTYIVRVFPSVCFGEGMFVISGNQLAIMMFPNTVHPDIYALLSLSESGFRGGIGTGLIYMSCVLVVSVVALVVLEYLRVIRVSQRIHNSCRRCLRCCKGNGDKEALGTDGCADVCISVSAVLEEERVCAEECGPATDCIAVQHLTKRYFGAPHVSLNDVSLGVHEGEVMGLLGLNGAGKTTLIAILAGETDASSGAAFVNRTSVMSAKSRAFVGYCPQYDALLDDLTSVEHLWLYARLRGMREEMIKNEVSMLIKELGLYVHRNTPSHALSGGNKRRLSLAMALVGRTKSVLLDEPTAGMDAQARRQTCTMIRRLTGNKSVMLTTHLLDEAEALADRVSFIVDGRLKCVGTPQELKAEYTDDNVYTMGVQFPNDVNLDECDAVVKVHEHVLDVVKGGEGNEDDDHQKASCEVAEVHSSSIVLNVRGHLSDICTAMSSLREGGVEGVPTVSYVSVSQPTLEDILLL